jgi:ribosomal protein S18 acetylase RimI-like enzyme
MLKFELANSETIPNVLEMMEDFYSLDDYPFDNEKNEKNLKVFISNPELGRLWLIKFENQIVGYICLTFGFSFEFGGRDAFIDEFFIKAEFRNMGIGQQTMDFIENESKELEVKSIHLEVEKHNKTGNKLYLNKGYVDTGRHLLTKSVNIMKVEK